jgi:hypothetical protein
MMLALFLTNSAAIAAATCRHGSTEAHAHARISADAHVAAEALAEEHAAESISDAGVLADLAQVQLGGFILPPAAAWTAPQPSSHVHGPAPDAGKRPDPRAEPPLRPPLA